MHVPRRCIPTQCGLESLATNGHECQKQVLPRVREADQIREDWTEQHPTSAAGLRDCRRLVDRLALPSVQIGCQPPPLRRMRVERLSTCCGYRTFNFTAAPRRASRRKAGLPRPRRRGFVAPAARRWASTLPSPRPMRLSQLDFRFALGHRAVPIRAFHQAPLAGGFLGVEIPSEPRLATRSSAKRRCGRRYP